MIMMPLSMVKSGESSSIKKINGRDDSKRHLENLGFIVGEDVMVVNEITGNLILNVRGSRVAISKSMANRIMV